MYYHVPTTLIEEVKYRQRSVRDEVIGVNDAIMQVVKAKTEGTPYPAKLVKARDEIHINIQMLTSELSALGNAVDTLL